MTDSHDPLSEPAVPRLGLSPVTLIAIALGGAIGTVARFLLDVAYPDPTGHFPTVTLVINLTGSLAIGFLVPLLEATAPRIPLARPFLVVGILGGWTTYSSFAVAAITLMQSGHAGASLAYLAATVVGGLGLVLLGNAGGRKVVAR
jgi:fluoride exporter